MQKVRRHKTLGLAPTACKRMVSGTISLPLWGTFHLSLTVLVHYRSPLVSSLAGWSPRIRSGFHVSGPTQEPTRSRSSFAYRTITFYGWAFLRHSATRAFCNSPVPLRRNLALALLPRLRNARRLHVGRFGLFPFRSPLLRESRFSFLSSGYSDVSFPRVPSSHPMCSGAGDTVPVPGSPIRRSVLLSPLAAPHGLSQLATSFIGFRCQGIHHTPLLS